MKKFILGFFLGALGAGIPTYFITKKMIEDQCQKDINEMKEYYKKKNSDETDISDKEKEAIKNHVKKVPDKPIPKEYKNIVTSYASDSGESKKDAPDEYYDDAEKETPPEDKPDIEIISIDEYGEKPLYEQNCLIYYVNDMTLAYEDGQLVDNEKYLIEDALNIDNWRNDDNNDKNLYVRNNRIQEDFEIAKCFGAYGDLN